MLIDDDYGTNLYHQIVIEEGGFAEEVVVKTSGEDALEYLKTRDARQTPKTNLIFLDINMPRMNGWEFLEEYAKLSPGQQAENVVVMLSTSSYPEDLKKADENPLVREYRSKPVTQEMLKMIINTYWS